MSRLPALLLAGIIAFQAFYNVGVLGYWLANRDYIAANLCENRARPQLHCDGKCYLAKQLAKESDHNDKNPLEQNTSKTEIGQTVFFQTLTQFDFGIAAYWTKHDNFKPVQTIFDLLFTSGVSQPPELG